MTDQFWRIHGIRKYADWMAKYDNAILELCKLEGPKRTIEIRTELEERSRGFARPFQYVDRRCELLAEHGLLEQTTSGSYELTDLGEAYLVGAVDLADSDRSPRF